MDPETRTVYQIRLLYYMPLMDRNRPRNPMRYNQTGDLPFPFSSRPLSRRFQWVYPRGTDTLTGCYFWNLWFPYCRKDPGHSRRSLSDSDSHQNPWGLCTILYRFKYKLFPLKKIKIPNQSRWSKGFSVFVMMCDYPYDDIPKERVVDFSYFSPSRTGPYSSMKTTYFVHH